MSRGRISVALFSALCAGALTACSAPISSGLSINANMSADSSESSQDDAIAQADRDIAATSVGDCLNVEVDRITVTSVTTVECSQPHQAEVYKNISLGMGDFPGRKSVISTGQKECMAAFEPYVGADPHKSEVTFNFFHPTANSWSTSEDTNRIVCYVTSRDRAPLTGSAKGLGR